MNRRMLVFCALFFFGSYAVYKINAGGGDSFIGGFAGGTMGGLLGGAISKSSSNDGDGRGRQTKRDLQELQDDVSELQTSFSRIERSLKNDLTTLNTKCDEALQQNDSLEKDIKELVAQHEKIQEQLRTILKRLDILEQPAQKASAVQTVTAVPEPQAVA